MKNTLKLLSIAMVICMLLCSCAQGGAAIANSIINNVEENENVNNVIPNTGNTNIDTGSLSASNTNGTAPEKGTYNEGVVLVKYDGEFTENVLEQLDFKSTEPLYAGSAWYTVTLGDSMDTVEAVDYLTELGCFEKVDYDYIMGVTAEVANTEISGNPNYENSQKDYYKTQGVIDAWQYLEKEGKNPGGSSDVIIAVIDTGVDYNHIDLRNNIWINAAEIPNNGRDDDGNGYIDDVYGWDFVSNDKDPMDDNGHGTHVAGIIAAENNKEGGIGVAYNCKVMVLKAGNSSGYFNNSDIAEAIQYAYMNGASVINMSFAGSSISIAFEDALEEAYNSCILVAAAGNDGAPNESLSGAKPRYPAVLPYVIGVMSVDKNGQQSSFSNYDAIPYNRLEYEVYAIGSSVYSTWPNNKFETINGTSMAAPTVAGIAALLRSYFNDREVYSPKFIQSQIVNTGTVSPDEYHTVVDAYKALTEVPTPNVKLYDYYINDNTSISNKNNGNGVIDAGETVRLYVSLHNKGGVASDVNVTIDAIRNNDPSLTDPYFVFANTSIKLSDIGTYSVREPYENQYFEIVVSPDCPNDYITDFNIYFTYKNGLNDKDTTNYNGYGVAQFIVSRGYHLPSLITEDTTFINDRLYIVGDDVVIPEGVTVIFEEGCQIQFYDGREYYASPRFIVYGNLEFKGTEKNRINIYPVDSHTHYVCLIQVYGKASLVGVDAINLVVYKDNYTSSSSYTNTTIHDCNLYQQSNSAEWLFVYADGSYDLYHQLALSADTISDCYLEVGRLSAKNLIGNFIKFGSFNGSIYCGNYSTKGYCANNIISSYPSLIYGNPHLSCNFHGSVTNNMFITRDDTKSSLIEKIVFHDKTNLQNNYFSEIYREYGSQLIKDYIGSDGNPTVDLEGSCSDITKLWPYVVSVEMLDKDGEPVTVVGKEKITVRVTFNKPMDTAKNTSVSFGTFKPYADYRFDGEYISSTVWEGTYTLKSMIENGQNYLKVNNACAADGATKIVVGDHHIHEFTIDTTAAMAMDIFANPTKNGIELSWVQDDYDTLLGYNVYRLETQTGVRYKLNSCVVPKSDANFLDTTAKVGKTYWYTFTVVFSDFSESKPAGMVSATPMDTTPPTINHTPPAQGYLNQNLIISCTASDNVKVDSVILYYRTVGAAEWRKLTMSKANNQYRATIFGSSLDLDGLEYFLVASDGISEGFRGNADNPIRIFIKHADNDHDFTGDWLSNQNGHWHTCPVCGEMDSFEAHLYSNGCDTSCNTCGYERTITHKYDNVCDTTCNTCGYTRSIIHAYGDWYETKAPTCTTTGTDEHKCSVCQHTEARTIDARGHDYATEWTVDVAPTCTTVGSKSHHCSRCGDKTDVTEIPANGHINSNAVVENKVDATCTVDGSYDSVTYCSVCKVEVSRESKVINKLGHDYSIQWTVDVEPTCTTTGSKSRYCTRCDSNTNLTHIPALGHRDINNNGICDECDEKLNETETPETPQSKEHTCEKVGVFKAFWNAIVNFFRRLFGKPEICTCGEILIKEKEH